MAMGDAYSSPPDSLQVPPAVHFENCSYNLPEPGVFGSLEPELTDKKKQEPEPLKKTGAEAAKIVRLRYIL